MTDFWTNILGIIAIITVAVIYTGILIFVFEKAISRFEDMRRKRKN